MSASDVLAVVAATIVTLLVGALAVLLVQFARTLRSLRAMIEQLRVDAIELLDATSEAVGNAEVEVERVDRLLTNAERIDDVKRSLATPMVKAMAFGTGVSRATRRLRDGEPSPRRRRRKRAS
jgi:hypothetical protein